ncbi:MAG: anthranilate phosphoribosyltransferase [Acidobacteriota bacterium]
MIKEIIKQVVAREDLTRAQAATLLEFIIDGDATDAQIAALLIALAMKGETSSELAGFAEVMRQRAARFNTRHKIFVDTAGTGGDGRGTFNISTAAAFVIAAAGIPVAKHGNRSVSSQSGSADVLSELGVRVVLSPAIAAHCLDEIGICFMFAPAFHPATKRVAEIRRQLGIRTAFNLLGPLTNPAGTPRQLVGVFAREAVEKCARVLADLGAERAWVVWGMDGLDEITLCDTTLVGEVINSSVNLFEIGPQDFGLTKIDPTTITGGTPAENAVTLRAILSGKRQDGLRDIVLANAAAAIYLCEGAPTLRDAIALAAGTIDTGLAVEKLDALIHLSQQCEPT